MVWFCLVIYLVRIFTPPPCFFWFPSAIFGKETFYDFSDKINKLLSAASEVVTFLKTHHQLLKMVCKVALQNEVIVE